MQLSITLGRRAAVISAGVLVTIALLVGATAAYSDHKADARAHVAEVKSLNARHGRQIVALKTAAVAHEKAAIKKAVKKAVRKQKRHDLRVMHRVAKKQKNRRNRESEAARQAGQAAGYSGGFNAGHEVGREDGLIEGSDELTCSDDLDVPLPPCP